MKLILIALTLANLALILFGGSMAMLAPMMFDAGGQQDQVLWAVFWSIWALPVVAFAGAILPGLFLWLRWRRVAVATAAVPAVFAVAILAVIFTK
jgi:hypothetical protein